MIGSRASRVRRAAPHLVQSFLLGSACAAGLAGCATITQPVAPSQALAAASPDAVTAYLVYNHFHSGLTVPTAALVADPGPTAEAVRQLVGKRWTSLGYGDAKFYEHQGIDPGRVLDFFRSMFAPGNPSVINLAGVDDPLRDASHPHILELSLPRERFRALVRRVDASFALKDGAPEFLVRGSGDDDRFYRGLRPASAIHECNQWIGEILGAAGVPHTPVLDTTSDGLALDLKTSGHAVPLATAGP